MKRVEIHYGVEGKNIHSVCPCSSLSEKAHSFDGVFVPENGPIAAVFRTLVSKNLMKSLQNVEMIEEDASKIRTVLCGLKIAANFREK